MFGDVEPQIAEIKQPLRMAGQYHDAETGLFYNYFRYYDPRTGRYLRPDPVGLADGMNPYVYVGGNPVMAVDPLGLFTSLQKCYQNPAMMETCIAAGMINAPKAKKVAEAVVNTAIVAGGTIAVSQETSEDDCPQEEQTKNEKEARKKAYNLYKEIQKKGYEKPDDPCKKLRNKINFLNLMIAMRSSFDSNFPHKKYPMLGRHFNVNVRDAIDLSRSIDEYKKMCMPINR